jgi:beta-phosphoglucomutase-like phosphatase (HAD superfamily)
MPTKDHKQLWVAEQGFVSQGIVSLTSYTSLYANRSFVTIDAVAMNDESDDPISSRQEFLAKCKKEQFWIASASRAPIRFNEALGYEFPESFGVLAKSVI